MKENLVVGSKKINLKYTYQGPQRAAQDQHPDPNSMEQLDSTVA
jgi:hypothetical protein